MTKNFRILTVLPALLLALACGVCAAELTEQRAASIEKAAKEAAANHEALKVDLASVPAAAHKKMLARLLEVHPQASYIANLGEIYKQGIVSCDQNNVDRTGYYIEVVQGTHAYFYVAYVESQEPGQPFFHYLDKLAEMNLKANVGPEEIFAQRAQVIALREKAKRFGYSLEKNLHAVAQLYPLTLVQDFKNAQIGEKTTRKTQWGPVTGEMSFTVELKDGSQKEHHFTRVYAYAFNPYDNYLYDRLIAVK